MPVCALCLARTESIATEDFCPGCGRSAAAGEPLCLECRFDPPEYDSAYCAAHYRRVPRALVHLLKYERVRTVAPWMAAALDTAKLPVSGVDLVVPVPLGPGRGRRRGFNQSEAIARHLARRRGWRLAARALARRRETLPQAGLSAEERKENVRGAFRARAELVAGRRVLLVDDVLTTGATARACAVALKSAGARAVRVAAFARADLRWTAVDEAGDGREARP
ncbi:MAG: ComF family protein [Terriglobales bacterium]